MTVFVMDCAPIGARGELTRWLLEVKPGVFVGKINAAVRELLWEKVCGSGAEGAVMIYDSPGEQGFAMELHGTPKRSIVDFEGILLVCCTEKTETKKTDGPGGENT